MATSGKVRLQFLGDISLNGLLCDPQYFVPLEESLVRVAERLGSCDLRLGNFESPLWAGQGFNLKKEPRVCTTGEAAAAILPLGLDVAVLANNHFYDCLDLGATRTREFLRSNGIASIGTGPSLQQAGEPYIRTVGDLTIGILAYLDPLTNPHSEDARSEYANFLDEATICEEVAALSRRVDVAIVSLHWGQYEFLRFPTPRQKTLGRKLIESGARIVVGHHSHCMQGYEIWNEGVILYSMGNFVFAGGKGKEHAPWPRHSRQVSVAEVCCNAGATPEVQMHHFVQDGFRLREDQSAARLRAQERLNEPLAYDGPQYARIFRKELRWQWMVLAPFRFIRDSGGLFRALRRMRWQHVVALKRMLFR